MAIAINCVLFLVSTVVFGLTVAIPATVFSALVFSWFWYGLPLARAALELQSQEQKWQHSSKGMSY